jgi:hypothetical protein
MNATDSLRTFDPAAMADLRRRLDYSPTWWERFIQRIKSWWPSFDDTLNPSPHALDSILEIAFYVVVVIGLLALLWIFFRADLAGIWAAQPQKALDDVRITEQDLENVNFDQSIADAVARKQYRLAVRYSYLKILKMLSDRGLIVIRQDKTNRQYVRELKEPLRTHFKALTRLFDYAWYGNRTLSETDYAESRGAFGNMEKLIAATDDKY